MDLSVALLAVAGLLVLAWVWRRGRASRAAETQLRTICLGNERQMERLIEGEMNRAPGIPRGEAARRAVQRYQRDNR
jgi:hypothetical protein